MNFSDRLNKVIPGGAHTYSRGDDQYPINAPQILSHGKGAYVFDADGKKFLDYGMGLRSVTVGYNYDEISEAGIAEIRKGNNLTRASLTELEAAELMISLFPWAEQVKFAKNGSVVTTAAVKMSRAFNGKKYVATCAEHPFFTYDDWSIGTTPMNKGIPAENISLSLKFHYNDLASLEKLFAEHPNEISCVMLEPATFVSPCAGDGKIILDKKGCDDKTLSFLHNVKALCRKNGAVFILDEMITGFRWDLHGAMSVYDIEPDLATFGKGMANGFALAALIGKREIMDLGGIRNEGQERVFLISTTHGSEMSAFGAFIKTIDVYKKQDVTAHLWDYGKQFITGINSISTALGLENHFNVEGFSCSPYYFTKDAEGNTSFEFRTLFAQEMIKHGVLIPWVALSYSHGKEELDLTFSAVEKSLKVYKAALADGIDKHLVGRAIKPVFRKYN